MLMATYKADARHSLQAYLVHGIEAGSPDHALGVMLTSRFD
jgi:hypothetical protein